jgi:hypothetical protein
MQLSELSLPRDPQTGRRWYDDAYWTPCDGTCGEVFSNSEVNEYLTEYPSGRKFCRDCSPACFCGEPQFPGGEGCCAVHELDAWTEALRDDPADAEAKRMIQKIGGVA